MVAVAIFLNFELALKFLFNFVFKDEHFEDFTTASDWELFTAKLEQLLSEWMGKPAELDNITNGWVVVHEKITFAG